MAGDPHLFPSSGLSPDGPFLQSLRSKTCVTRLECFDAPPALSAVRYGPLHIASYAQWYWETPAWKANNCVPVHSMFELSRGVLIPDARWPAALRCGRKSVARAPYLLYEARQDPDRVLHATSAQPAVQGNREVTCHMLATTRAKLPSGAGGTVRVMR